MQKPFWKYRNQTGLEILQVFAQTGRAMIVPGWMMVVVTLDNCYLPLGKSCGLLLNPDLH